MVIVDTTGFPVRLLRIVMRRGSLEASASAPPLSLASTSAIVPLEGSSIVITDVIVSGDLRWGLDSTGRFLPALALTPNVVKEVTFGDRLFLPSLNLERNS